MAFNYRGTANYSLGAMLMTLTVLAATIILQSAFVSAQASSSVYIDTDFACVETGTCGNFIAAWSIPQLGITFDSGTLQYEEGIGAVSNSSTFGGVFGHLERYDLVQAGTPLLTSSDGTLVTLELTQSCETYNVDENLPFTGIRKPLRDYRLACGVTSLNDFTNGIYFGTVCDGSYIRASWGVLPQVLRGNQVAWYESSHVLKSRPNSIKHATSLRIVYDRDEGTVSWFIGNKRKPSFVARNIGIPEIGSADLGATFLEKGTYPEAIVKSNSFTLGFGTSNFEDHLEFGQTQALTQLEPIDSFSTMDGTTLATYQKINPNFLPENYGQGAANALKSLKVTVSTKA